MNDEITASRRMLRELADLAEHASLTGSLSDGVGRAITRYNALLERLIQQGSVPQGLFTPLPASSSYGDIGVEARMLMSHLGENGNGHHKHKGKDASVLLRLAPFVKPEDLSSLVREQIKQHSGFDMELLTHLAPFLEQSMLSELLKQHLQSATQTASAPAQAPSPPTAQPAASNFTPAAAPEAQPAKPEDLLELLKNPHLSEAERNELVEKLTRSVS